MNMKMCRAFGLFPKELLCSLTKREEIAIIRHPLNFLFLNGDVFVRFL